MSTDLRPTSARLALYDLTAAGRAVLNDATNKET